MEILITLIGWSIWLIVVILFGILNFAGALMSKRNSVKPGVSYSPVPRQKKQQPATQKPQNRPQPQPKAMTVQQFVKKNVALIDSCLQKGKTFTLSEELLKELGNAERGKLSMFFMDMPEVKQVKNIPGKFTVYMG